MEVRILSHKRTEFFAPWVPFSGYMHLLEIQGEIRKFWPG